MKVQHCRLLRISITQDLLGSSSYQESAAVWANISTKQWKSYHRVQSSGNGRQPWERSYYQAVNECDKGSASPFYALWLLLVRAAVVTYRCPGAMISKGQSSFGIAQSPHISTGSHYTKDINSHWPSPPQCSALQITWDPIGQTWCFFSD